MKRAGQVVTVIVTLLAFAGGFVGTAAALDITQPVAARSTAVVAFPIMAGDNSVTISDRLAQDGLIGNSKVFWALARLKHLDAHLVAGTYMLSPSMSMTAILTKLSSGHPDRSLTNDVQILIPPGHRVTEYPEYFLDKQGNPLLPNFDAKVFLQIATTGVLPDGKKLSDLYWYVEPKQKDVAYALEGYLFADTYDFNTSDDAVAVVQRLLDGLGEQLCPGPDAAHPDAYIHDPAQCKAHGRTVKVAGKDTNIFTLMEQRFSTTNDTQALYVTLTMGSIVVREAGQNPNDVPGIADVYYNRYLTWKNNTNNPAGEVVSFFGADPTAIYARDTDNPPKNGQWWAPLADAAKNVDPNNPYNTANPDHKGPPPGPIATPRWVDIAGIAAADDPTPSPYYYFVNDKCGKTYYAQTLDEQNANIATANGVKSC